MQWLLPLDYARALHTQDHLVLLYSGQSNSYSGRYSLLAWGLEEVVQGTSFELLREKLSNSRKPFDNAWFGYFGYGLKNALEVLPQDAPARFSMPDLWMGRFRHILRFDHETRGVENCGPEHAEILPADFTTPKLPSIGELGSNMSKAEYFEKAQIVLDAIFRGDLYQANLTRKFWGSFNALPDGLGIYRQLCTKSPAPFSAYIRINQLEVLSSSPESFLQIEKDGKIIARPIKGSAPRGTSPQEDETLKAKLLESIKDRAENLMIVDLLRNDLSRIAENGSVEVSQLFECATLPSIHHLYSTIEAYKIKECSTLDAITACFPPGSMTGAPKIAAIKLCSELEGKARGVYSGALGWLGGDGSAQLSVVIRTLLLQGKEFEFQVGGGIVADSNPEHEWQETLLKAKNMAQTLNIAPAKLAEI